MRVAIIPARGGSKRIPRKNIVPFHGKPIIAWSIEAALASGCFDDVIVSTDSEEIAEVSRQHGASVPFMRPPELSDDHTDTVAVVKHAIEWLGTRSQCVEQVCCIYATAPLIDPADIRHGQEVLTASGCDYVFSATTFPYPIQRALRIDSRLQAEMFYPEYARTRSQDLDQAWHDAAQFYWGKQAAWREGKRIFEANSRVVPVPRARVHDIDTPEDLERLELMFTALEAAERHSTRPAPQMSLREAGLTSKLSLGTVQFGMAYGVANEQGQVSPPEVGEILRLAWESGIHGLDTAIAYGDSEAVLGGIGASGWDVVTKLSAVPDTVADVYAWAREQIAGSLERLRLEKVDALLLHRPDQLLGARGSELLAALHRLKDEGFTTKIGVSVYSPRELEPLLEMATFDVVQAPCNILDRRLVEGGWAQRLRDMGVELHARSVFLQGLLLMSEEQRPPKFRRWNRIWRTWTAWLEEHKLDALEACLLYSLSVPEVRKVVVGVDGASHLQAILQTAPTGLPELPQWPEEPAEELLNPGRWTSL